MELDEGPFNHSVFAKNRDRLLEHEVAGRFFEGVLAQARSRELLSTELWAHIAGSAYNLVRIAKLGPATA